ncbi:MAG: class I SAM-dependent methyltransferase [Desulfovibrio sp.]
MKKHNNQVECASQLQDLRRLIGLIGPGVIWREIKTPDGEVLDSGVGDISDWVYPDHSLDFQGKSILDFGCNVGHGCFMAIERGASYALGIDREPLLIECASKMAELTHATDMEFVVDDLTSFQPEREFDVAMLLDFVGKNTVAENHLDSVLDALGRMNTSELLLTLRPKYYVRKHLKSTVPALKQMYSDNCVDDECFYLVRYVLEKYADQWELATAIHGDLEAVGTSKVTVHLKRKMCRS